MFPPWNFGLKVHEVSRLACFYIFFFKDEVKRTGETGVEETILEGHIGVTKELLAFQTAEKKYYIGCEKGGANLIKVSRMVLIYFNYLAY